MATAKTFASASDIADRAFRGLSSPLIELIRGRIARLNRGYHPERHYMRGPGPKWHAKHDRPGAADTSPNEPGIGQAV